MRLEMERRQRMAKMLEGDANDDMEVNFGYVSVHNCFALQTKEFLGGVSTPNVSLPPEMKPFPVLSFEKRF